MLLYLPTESDFPCFALNFTGYSEHSFTTDTVSLVSMDALNRIMCLAEHPDSRSYSFLAAVIMFVIVAKFRSVSRNQR